MYRTDKDEKAPLNADGKASTKKADTKALIGLAEAVKLSASLSAITLESTKGSTLPIETLKGGDKKARIVDLARKGLSFISAIFIGVLMRGNTHVTELVLNSNDVTASGAMGTSSDQPPNSALRPPASDLRPPTSDLLTSDLRPLPSDV